MLVNFKVTVASTVCVLPMPKLVYQTTGTPQVVVFSGLFDATPNIDALASVLGHEVAHVLANHGGEKISKVSANFPGHALPYVTLDNMCLALVGGTRAAISSLLGPCSRGISTPVLCAVGLACFRVVSR